MMRKKVYKPAAHTDSTRQNTEQPNQTAPDTRLEWANSTANLDADTTDSAFELEVPESVLPDSHRIGPYKLLSKLGAGGMGVVYRAIHVHMNREVALKVLKANRADNQESIARFDREMQAVGRLNHPNIVTGYDAGETNGHFFIAMEVLDGMDLTSLSKSFAEPLDANDACELVRQTALALQFAHRNGVYHRDVKPSNIMLCRKEQSAASQDQTDLTSGTETAVVKLLDLGLATLEFHDMEQESLTEQSQVVGTMGYLSPEQCMDSRQIDGRADIYSLGATLFRLVAGTTPLDALGFRTAGQQIKALVLTELPSVTTVRPDLPEGVASLIDRAIKRDANDRFPSIDEMLQPLTEYAAGHDIARLLDQAVERQEAPVVTRHPKPELASEKASEKAVAAASRTPAFSADGPTWVRKLALAALPIGLVLLGVVIWLKTDGGYLRIDADPSIQVSVDVIKDGKIIDSIQTGSNDSSHWYRSGQYEIRLSAEASDSYTLNGQEFSLTRGANPVVSISRVTNGQRAAEIAKESEQRSDDATAAVESDVEDVSAFENTPQGRQAIARWILANEGDFATEQGLIQSVADIPQGAFEVHRIGLRDVDNDKARKVCELIPQLVKCDQLYLNGGRNRLLNDDAMESIGKLSQLKWLTLESAKITDAGIKQLPRMPGLQSLGLLDLRVTEQCLASASIKFPNLGSLNIFSLSLSGDDLKPLTTYSNLRSLDLITPYVSIDLLTPVTSTKIDTLMLRGIERIDAGIGNLLANMPDLEDLGLQNCNFNDDELQAASKSRSLKFLRLNNANISVDGLRAFLDAQPNVIVYIEYEKSPLLELEDLPQVKDVSGNW